MALSYWLPRGALLSAALISAGCANQLSQRNEHESRSERSVVSRQLHIAPNGELTLSSPSRNLRVENSTLFDVKEFQVTRRYDRYTPYQAWRELYEVPLGSVTLVAALGANVVDVLSFGQVVPKTATRGWLSYGLDGLNPLMNTESNGRAQQNLASYDEQLIDERQERITQPWAEQPVTLRIGAEQIQLETDPQGNVLLDLTSTHFLGLDTRWANSLLLVVNDEQKATQGTSVRFALAPELQQHLPELQALLLDDLESDDLEQWVQRVERLNKLGFPEQANELELTLIELSQDDEPLQQTLKERLALLPKAAAHDTGETIR